jgi:alkylation response protein AidB-like acyl-CoA dehydrogenase
MSKRALFSDVERASLGKPPSSNAAQPLLMAVRKLAPSIAARAAEIEASRQIPADTIDDLKSIGVFRMFVPQSHGGLELDLPAGLEILVELAKIDGSVGWNAMTSSNGSLFAPYLPQQTYETIYRDGPDVIFAGATQPAGTAEEVGRDVWQVSGRWPFVSGSRYADWIAGFCVVIDKANSPLSEAAPPAPLIAAGAAMMTSAATSARSPAPAEEGPSARPGRPHVQAAWLPARDWQIEDTWHSAGLRGTGSHHAVLKNRLVPASNFSDLERGAPFLSGPLYTALPQFLPLLHAATALGIAEGAVSNLIELAATGRQQVQSPAPMRDSETFQFVLGRVVADLRAARAFFQMQCASHWRRAVAGTLKGEGLLAESTQAAIWTTATCVRVADDCFALAGGSAVYESSPLQRRLRDLHVAGQHARLQQRHYVSAGRQLLAQGREIAAAA